MKIFFSKREALSRLILINIGVWFLLALVTNLTFLFSTPESGTSGLFKTMLTEYLQTSLALPANIEVFLSKPWTIISYMFLHFDFWHILFNMLWLYWFGVIFVEYLSQRQLLATYIFGGIAGGLLYILSYNAFPVFNLAKEQAIALGASASVLAIVVAIAVYVPNYTLNLFILGPVKIKYIALITILIDVLTISKGNAGGHIAHLGGAFWGFMYIKMLPHVDPSKLFSIFSNDSIKKFREARRHKFKVQYGKTPVSDEDYNLQKKEKQQRIDKILDKISQSGYNSLTKEEKELLFSSSKKQNN
ncbi:MAG TPA: rhomboid family intramembrane serine protease [Lentimicrobium sp.]|nr:rhomboid family intramembrane serine protease [Lentimicrobium sp.]